MKFFTKSLLDGFGSALDLYPREVVRLRDLRDRYHAELGDIKVLQKVRLRNRNAATIRRSLNQIAEHSTALSNHVKTLSARGSNGDNGNDQHADAKLSSKLHVRVSQHPSESGSFATFSLYSDSVQGLADMLALRDDYQKIFQDLNKAGDSITTRESPEGGARS